VILAF
jgi:hypothetical protein